MLDDTIHPISDFWVVSWSEKNLWYLWLQYKLRAFWERYSNEKSDSLIILSSHLLPCEFVLLVKSQDALQILDSWILEKPDPVVCLFDTTSSILDRKLSLPPNYRIIWIENPPPLDFVI